jgi:hypothetical protein
MSDRDPLWGPLERSVLDGAARTPAELRRAVAGRRNADGVSAFVEKIHLNAYKVTDEEVASLIGTRGEEEVFEVIVACAVGAGLERVNAALKAIEEA